MTQYNFTKAGVSKPFAFDPYLRSNFPLYLNMSYTDPDLVITTTQELTVEELATLDGLVASYVDPAVFLQLDTTETDSSWSKATSSSVATVVQTFIQSPKSPSGSSGVFNAMKTILAYEAPNVAAFAEGSTTATVDWEIFDFTRQISIDSLQVDISSTVEGFQTAAINGATGSQLAYQTFMIQGLRTQVPDYDCIWQFKLAVSDPRLSVRLNSIQSLYYNLL